MTESILDVQAVDLRFGGVRALSKVSLQIREGEIFSLIGPNGAGKTSLANCTTGHYHPTDGQIRFRGLDITDLPPHRIARAGISRTYQNIELFRGMRVMENLLLGRHRHMRTGALLGGIFYGRARREELEHREKVEEIIDFLEIAHVRGTPVSLLPYGLQKRVDLGRALAMEPDLLILDEPMAGMNVEEKADMARFVIETREQRGVTMMLIEHDMGVVMDLSDQVAVLDFGELIAHGPPDDVRNDPRVLKAYVGDRAQQAASGQVAL